MQFSDDTSKLWPAFIKARGEFDPATKDGKNPHFRSTYATLQSVIDATQPALTANGLVQMQPIRITENGDMVVQTYITHTSGQFIMSEYPVSVANSNNRSQAEGSAVTYARRYSLMAMLGLAPEDDDDGNANHGEYRRASSRQSQKSQQPSRSTPEPQSKAEPKLGSDAKAFMKKVESLGFDQRAFTAMRYEAQSLFTGTEYQDVIAQMMVIYARKEKEYLEHEQAEAEKALRDAFSPDAVPKK